MQKVCAKLNRSQCENVQQFIYVYKTEIYNFCYVNIAHAVTFFPNWHVYFHYNPTKEPPSDDCVIIIMNIGGKKKKRDRRGLSYIEYLNSKYVWICGWGEWCSLRE